MHVDFVTTRLYPTGHAFGADGEGRALSRYADAPERRGEVSRPWS
ncbi:hypothetical protein [Myceligenerans cantabricum]